MTINEDAKRDLEHVVKCAPRKIRDFLPDTCIECPRYDTKTEEIYCSGERYVRHYELFIDGHPIEAGFKRVPRPEYDF